MFKYRGVTDFVKQLTEKKIEAGLVVKYAQGGVKPNKDELKKKVLKKSKELADYKDVGKKIHKICENEEYRMVKVEMATEVTGKQIELINTINQLNQLLETGVVREFVIKCEIYGNKLSGIIDRLEWDGKTGVLHVLDLKTHKTKFIYHNPDMSFIPQSYTYYYKCQLNTYIHMFNWLLTCTDDEIRTKFLGGIFNTTQPIHTKLCFTMGFKVDTNMEDLISVLNKLRNKFDVKRWKSSVIHIDQEDFQKNYRSGKVDTVVESMAFSEGYLKDQIDYNPLEVERQKSIADTYKKTAIKRKRDNKKKAVCEKKIKK